MNTAKRSFPSKKSAHSPAAADRIIAAATTLFTRHGFDGTSTKDICASADVNIAAIHYYFESKEGLYRTIIERFGDTRLVSVQRLLTGPKTLDEMGVKLELFLSESLDAFIQQPELCRIVQTEIELLSPRCEDVFRRTFVRLFDTLVAFLQEARRMGFVRSEVDPKVAAQFLMNQLRQVTRAERVNERFFGMSIRDERFRSKWLEQTLSIFVAGIVHDQRARAHAKQDRSSGRKRAFKSSDV